MQKERQPPFVLIVEDHPLVADSLVACVQACDTALDVEIAESLQAALQVLALRPSPLLIITDLTLTDAIGADAVKRLREAEPAALVLVFTALDDPLLREEAMALGVAGYIIKSASTQLLRNEIRAAIGDRSGSFAVPEKRPSRLRSLLTPKQFAVLEELVAGRSNKEIAARMKISDETVGSHMKEIFGRLAVRNRTEAVVRYLQMIGSTDDLS